ncbi:hypothetical protein HDU67_008598 [Dinochytrium kinnereticum]|nr:hypothetical protein HDU67_008598 [Dinochytrium kinnereticum]
MDLRGKNVFITGGSRGIGLAIAIRLGQAGCNVAIAAKTAEPHPKLPGTIYTAAKQIDAAGGRGLPIICDIRFEDQVQKAIDETVKAFDLMNQINGRGTWLCSKIALPHLIESAKKGRNPHILTLSPPLDMRMMWFEPHVAYTMAKFAMSMCTLGLAGELREHGIAANALWPKTAIETSAVTNVIAPTYVPETEIKAENIQMKMRTSDIMSDAAYVILSQDAKTYTGQFTIDEFVLKYQGVTDFKKYRTHPDCEEDEIAPDFFVPENPWDFLPPPRQVLQGASAKSKL